MSFDKQKKELEKEALATGEMMELNQEVLPGCLYHRTALNDVARTENLTFICTPEKEEAGPTNNWMKPEDAYTKLEPYFLVRWWVEPCMSYHFQWDRLALRSARLELS